MAVDSPAFIDSALKVYHVEVHRAIKAQEEQLSQLCSARDQLQQTMQTLAELPDRLRHTAMIPLGKHAFFPGHLTRTNEVMVHLGDQYFVETTAAAARGILQRKLDVVSTGVSRAEQQLQALRARLDVTQSSLREDAADGEATEIRSSLEESDALLASAASKRKQAAAAARQRHQQQGQGVVSRVRTASGYSYTPLGLSEVQQQQQQQQQDPEDAALQARLEELIRLEEQQQQQAEEQDAPWDHQQQQQQLASIQEGEEEDEGEEPAAAADSKAGVHAAAQHLQQLEEQTDSDDEDAPQHRLLPPQQQQQQQQQDGRQQHEKAAAAGHIAASTAAAPSRPPLKSALKKGFLTSPSKPKASSSSSSTSSSSSSTASGSGSSSAAQRSSATAFTGAVVERPVLAVDDSETVTAVPAVVERVPLAAPPPASTSSASRPSKFKLRRMGLEASE